MAREFSFEAAMEAIPPRIANIRERAQVLCGYLRHNRDAGAQADLYDALVELGHTKFAQAVGR